jgi:DNA repair ATPase RecN
MRVMGQVGRLLDALDQKNLGGRAADTLTNVNLAVDEMRAAVHGLQADKLSAQAQTTLASLNETLGRASTMLDRLQGDKGVLASTERAASAVGDVAHGARGLGTQLEETLQDVRDAATAVKQLGDSLERDPDMLLKGRSRISR